MSGVSSDLTDADCQQFCQCRTGPKLTAIKAAAPAGRKRADRGEIRRRMSNLGAPLGLQSEGEVLSLGIHRLLDTLEGTGDKRQRKPKAMNADIVNLATRRVPIAGMLFTLFIGLFASAVNLRTAGAMPKQGDVRDAGPFGPNVQDIVILRENGGRVAWSPDGELIAFDMLGDDGFYDIYVMRPNGANERCLTCGKGESLPQRHIGNPAWHPSGAYLVFQVEKVGHSDNSFESTPGIGVHSDLWLSDVEGSRFWQLMDTPIVPKGSVLHPHFSRDGSRLAWSARYEDANLLSIRQFMGFYRLKIADFEIAANGPTLRNVRTMEPGGRGFYENHGFSPDGRKLLFTSNVAATRLMELDANDIYVVSVEGGEPTRLAWEGYNEHAQWSPNGKRIVWMSSVGNPNRGTDYWVMDADGSNKRRLTYFNRRSDPIGRGRTLVAADSDWSPDGRHIVGYVQTSLTKQTGFIVRIDLKDELTLGAAAEVRSREPDSAQPMSFLNRDGNVIRDADGQPVQLRGTHVEGWLMLNGPLLGAGLLSESVLEERLAAIVGQGEFDRFRLAIYEEFITERDFRMMAESGFNFARLSFNHTLIEDDDSPFVYKEDLFRYVDRAVEWGRRHGIYVALALHSAPGGQSRHFVADPDRITLWADEINRKRTVGIWREIARRYHDEPVIAGYDLLNEPDPRRVGELVGLYREIVRAIREHDQRHMIILEGTNLSTEFVDIPADFDRNLAYCFHTYALVLPRLAHARTRSQVREIAKLSGERGVPAFNCEFGANTIEWVQDLLELYEDPTLQIRGWTFWPWKRVPSPHNPNQYRHLYAIDAGPEWRRLMEAISHPIARDVPTKIALEGIKKFQDAMQAANLRVDAEMMRALRRHVHKPSSAYGN